MSDRDFFRDSADECRRLACRAANDRVRRELFLWAGRFDGIADKEVSAEADAAALGRFGRMRPQEAAD